jgi:hypothetical protein
LHSSGFLELKAGDVGVIVEHYPPRKGTPEGFELEFFSASGKTVTVVSVPASGIRKAAEGEVLSVREITRSKRAIALPSS